MSEPFTQNIQPDLEKSTSAFQTRMPSSNGKSPHDPRTMPDPLKLVWYELSNNQTFRSVAQIIRGPAIRPISKDEERWLFSSEPREG